MILDCSKSVAYKREGICEDEQNHCGHSCIQFNEIFSEMP